MVGQHNKLDTKTNNNVMRNKQIRMKQKQEAIIVGESWESIQQWYSQTYWKMVGHKYGKWSLIR